MQSWLIAKATTILIVALAAAVVGRKERKSCNI